MQDTADATYMLYLHAILTAVVNGQNCIAVRRCTTTQSVWMLP